MTIYVMPQAQVCDWDGEYVFPNADQYSYRQVEGHGSEKAFRYNGFEKTRTRNPNVLHTYQSDDYLRFQRIFTSGELEVGDMFILGIGAPELTELEAIVVRQRNVVNGLQLRFSVLDGNYVSVGGDLSVDFSNGCTDGRWDTQPVQKFRFDNSGNQLLAGENELFWVVAEVEGLPAQGEWLTDCSNDELPQFDLRVQYRDTCLNPTEGTCAPVDVYQAWAAAVQALATDVVIWRDIQVNKGRGGFDEVKTLPAI